MASKNAIVAAYLFALGFHAQSAAAQCADGTERVNGRCGAAPKARPLDANRIAVLPFRTTGLEASFAHIGRGIADLLSAEFNGEVGPLAVEAGEAYRAWERAGGARLPLTQTVALQVARDLGAGQLVLGSMVGNAKAFTVAATILRVADAKVLVSRVEIQGTEDSLPAVTNALATQLLGRAAGITGSVSNAALRAYLEGMALYHHPKEGPHCDSGCDAENYFLTAAKLDSTFLLPAYRLVLLRPLFGPTQGVGAFRSSFRYLWTHRQQLNPDQRVLLEAVADSDDVLFRMQALPRMERAIVALPNSAEAWDIIGDLYFHVGALIGRENWAQKSRQAFQRAVDLDVRLCVCAFEHLADFAYLDHDAKTFARYSLNGPWARYLAALLNGDRGVIHAARVVYARELSVASEGPSLVSRVLPEWLTEIPLPPGEVDSVLVLLDALANTPNQRVTLDQWTLMASEFLGRPNRAIAAAGRLFGSDSVQFYRTFLDYVRDDSAAAERLMALADKTGGAFREQSCNVALSRLRRADSTGARAVLTQLDPQMRDLTEIINGPRAQVPMICAQVLRGVLAALDATGAPLLFRADSLMRYMPRNAGDIWNYDLALAFARRGDYAMAASAARRHSLGIGRWFFPRKVVALRQEGRWAALAGDTAAAIKAYHEYLAYRSAPEPSLIPERDSVRAELAVLEKARVKARGSPGSRRAP